MKDYILSIGLKKVAKYLVIFFLSRLSGSVLSDYVSFNQDALISFVYSLLVWLANYLKIKFPKLFFWL